MQQAQTVSTMQVHEVEHVHVQQGGHESLQGHRPSARRAAHSWHVCMSDVRLDAPDLDQRSGAHLLHLICALQAPGLQKFRGNLSLGCGIGLGCC